MKHSSPGKGVSIDRQISPKPQSQSAQNVKSHSLWWLWVVAALCVLMNPVRASELPYFYDENLQACVQDQAIENGWHSAEDIVQLLCPNRNISEVYGLEQLPNLTELDLSHNPLQHLGPMYDLQYTLQCSGIVNLAT